jgi:Tfp pilus assembly protein PilF
LVAGTIQYMSPEQIRGESLDGRTDQFSMAAVAYEMLTGKPLFEARTAITLAQKIVNETPAPAHVRNPALPENTSAVLGKALDRQPSGRYPTCTAFADALIATFDGATVQAILRPPEDQPTMALTGMVDVGMLRAAQPGDKLTTAPVERRGRWSGHAPLLIATGLIVGTLGVTAVTLINGRTHGEAPTRPQPSYGPPPLMGPGPGALPEKPPVRPPRPPQFAEPPGFGGVPGNPRQRKDEHPRPEAAVPRPNPGPPAGLPLIEFPDFSKELHRPEAKILEDGRKQLAERNFGIAAELFTAAIAAAPNDYHAYFYRGAAYLGAGNLKQAQADYEKVVQLQPGYAQGWYQLGVAMEHQHRSKEALDNYAHASRLKPDMADAFYAEAMVHDQHQALKKALESLDMAIAANPKYFRGYQARAEIKKRLGDPSFADDLQKAKDLAAERRGERRHGPDKRNPDKEK